MTRSAISPRLAISTLLNTGDSCGADGPRPEYSRPRACIALRQRIVAAGPHEPRPAADIRGERPVRPGYGGRPRTTGGALRRRFRTGPSARISSLPAGPVSFDCTHQPASAKAPAGPAFYPLSPRTSTPARADLSGIAFQLPIRLTQWVSRPSERPVTRTHQGSAWSSSTTTPICATSSRSSSPRATRSRLSGYPGGDQGTARIAARRAAARPRPVGDQGLRPPAPHELRARAPRRPRDRALGQLRLRDLRAGAPPRHRRVRHQAPAARARAGDDGRRHRAPPQARDGAPQARRPAGRRAASSAPGSSKRPSRCSATRAAASARSWSRPAGSARRS